MPETWLAALERHINFVAIMGLVGLAMKEYRVYGRIKERMNELWFNYTPLRLRKRKRSALHFFAVYRRPF